MSATAKPVIWIFSTGTEILQGASVDRNSPWLSARLHEMGLQTARHQAIPDRAEALQAALTEATAQADLVITTGGLGPTCDDLNRPVIAQVWGTDLVEDAEALERMRKRFEARGRTMPASNAVQALIPRGGTILQNDHGTAPGFYLRPAAGGPRATLVALPGPPHEMKPMFTEKAQPLLAAQFAGGAACMRTLVLHTAGLPESLVNERVHDLFEADPRVNFALLAKLGHVAVRMAFIGQTPQESDQLVDQWRRTITERLGAENIYGEQETTLEQAVGELLIKNGQTLVTAESCTGGQLAGRVTDMPGSSQYFKEGFITYANEAKMARMGVAPDLIIRYGAVSGPVAEAMARGAREVAQTDWAVSITGIAGPTGGTDDKPVGTVWMAVCGPNGRPASRCHRFLGTREGVRAQATQAALEMLRRALLGVALDAPLTFDAK